jgi:hypothetical protein
MNDIAKQNIVEKLLSAIKLEGLTQTEVAKMFHVDPSYISSMKNPKWWKLCSAEAWDKFLQWVNSGQKLREYSEKHGKFMPEKHEPKAGTVISREISRKPIEKKEVEEHSPESVMPEEKDPEQARADHYAHETLKATEKMFYPEQSAPAIARTESQKVIIDIEINLIINGKKIEIK